MQKALAKLIIPLFAISLLAVPAAGCIVHTGRSQHSSQRAPAKSGKHRHTHCHRRGSKGKKVCHSHPHRSSHH